MKFNSIWISSVEHLDKFAEIANSSNFLQKVIGYYKIPAGFPHIRLMLIFKMPIVFFGSAEVNIEQNSVSFTPLDFKTFGGKYKNTQKIQFQLSKTDIQSVERYKPPPVFMKYFMINWVRIRTRHDILGGDFLICVGGSGPLMGKIQSSTDNLYNELARFTRQ